MHRFRMRRPSAGMSVAFVALIAALSGTAVALPGRSTVDSGDIRNGQVRSADLKNNDIRGRDIRTNTVKGSDIDESSLGKAPSAGNADQLGGLPAAAYAQSAQSGFTLASLTGAFTNFGGTFAPASFMKDTLGFVHLRGLMNCPVGLNQVAFVLPPGFRPAASLFTPLAVGVTGAGNATITAAGSVQPFLPAGGGAQACGLDGISFKAEQ